MGVVFFLLEFIATKVQESEFYSEFFRFYRKWVWLAMEMELIVLCYSLDCLTHVQLSASLCLFNISYFHSRWTIFLLLKTIRCHWLTMVIWHITDPLLLMELKVFGIRQFFTSIQVPKNPKRRHHIIFQGIPLFWTKMLFNPYDLWRLLFSSQRSSCIPVIVFCTIRGLGEFRYFHVYFHLVWCFCHNNPSHHLFPKQICGQKQFSS